MDSFVADRIYVDAPPERVFRAFITPGDALVWLDAGGIEIDARVGGAFRFERGDGSSVAGTIAELSPGSRLVIADCYEEAGGERRGPSRIVLSALPNGPGVWLDVRHEDLDGQPGWQDRALAVRRQWVRATVALKRHVEGI